MPKFRIREYWHSVKECVIEADTLQEAKDIWDICDDRVDTIEVDSDMDDVEFIEVPNG